MQATKPLAASAYVSIPSRLTALAPIFKWTAAAGGAADGRVVVWNGRDAAPELVMQPHAAGVLALGSVAYGRALLSVAEDGTLARIAVETGGEPATRKLDVGPSKVVAAAFSADGGMLVTGNARGELRVFDTASGALQHTLHRHRTEVQCLAVRPGTTTIASASAEADLRIWDGASGRELQVIAGDLSLFAVTFSPRDGTLASGGVDRRLTLREPAAFRTVGELALKAPEMVATLAWSPDGALLALGDVDDTTLSKGGVRVLNAADRSVLGMLEIPGPASNLVFVGARLLIGAGGSSLASWTIP